MSVVLGGLRSSTREAPVIHRHVTSDRCFLTAPTYIDVGSLSIIIESFFSVPDASLLPRDAMLCWRAVADWVADCHVRVLGRNS